MSRRRTPAPGISRPPNPGAPVKRNRFVMFLANFDMYVLRYDAIYERIRFLLVVYLRTFLSKLAKNMTNRFLLAGAPGFGGREIPGASVRLRDILSNA